MQLKNENYLGNLWFLNETLNQLAISPHSFVFHVSVYRLLLIIITVIHRSIAIFNMQTMYSQRFSSFSLHLFRIDRRTAIIRSLTFSKDRELSVYAIFFVLDRKQAMQKQDI